MSACAREVVSTTTGMVQVGVGLEFAENLQTAAAGQVEVEHDQGTPAKSSARRRNRIAVAGDVQLQAQVMVLEGFPGQQHVWGVVLARRTSAAPGGGGLVITGSPAFPAPRPPRAWWPARWAGW